MDGLLRKLTKADFEKGIFFPMAGMCQNAMHLDKPGCWGGILAIRCQYRQ